MGIYMGYIAMAFLIWGIVTTYRIAFYLRANQIKVNLWLLRFLAFKYLKQYKELTVKQTGRAGPLYYQSNIAFSLMAFSLLLGVFIHYG